MEGNSRGEGDYFYVTRAVGAGFRDEEVSRGAREGGGSELLEAKQAGDRKSEVEAYRKNLTMHI